MRTVNMYTAKLWAGVSARLTVVAGSVVSMLIEEIAGEQFP